MKKILHLFAVAIVCVSFASHAFAWTQTKVDKGTYGYQYTIHVSKGWNLIPLHNVGTFKLLPTPSVDQSLFRAIFTYLPLNKKYVDFYGGFNDQTLAEFQSNQNYLHTSAEWLYSTADLDLTFSTKSDAFSVLPPTLHAGWNLMTFPPQFSDRSYGWGDCIIEKLYAWDDVEQKWQILPPSPEKLLEEAAEGDLIGYGVAIKVDNTCTLAKRAGASDTSIPPGIPDN